MFKNFRIKRIYTFIIQSFLPLLCMTFFICLFIVLMQFLWSHIDKLVGKGLGIGVMAELFFYAALQFVPLALPLAVLLASLITFGNLGESLELLAMKASGISLFKIMRPLIFFIVAIAIGAFYFQNNLLPVANTKFYSLFWGIKSKSPELEIPEGVFYKEIDGYNIYVGRKDFKTGLLYDVTIYIFEGSNIENATVTVADSARLQSSEDGRYLKFSLWSGEQLGTFRETGAKNDPKHPKYRRESFTFKEVYIPYENDLERTDESAVTNRHVGKNLNDLIVSVDSLDQRLDSINRGYGSQLCSRTYFTEIPSQARWDTAYFEKATNPKLTPVGLDLDSIYSSLRISQQQQVLLKAKQKAERVVNTFDARQQMQNIEYKNRSLHEIEIHRKFALSIAVIIFFFIGAPLGAIIRKGGLAVPIIVSVLFFIIYYLIDNTGLKLAKDGEWAPWAGAWLSSYVLAPIGIFLTWRAINDSTLFDWDSYVIFFRRVWRKLICSRFIQFFIHRNKKIGQKIKQKTKRSNQAS